MQEASRGVDPFNEAPRPRRPPQDIERVDEDLEAVGAVLAGLRLYFIGALFFAASTAGLVCLKVMRTVSFTNIS